MTAVSVLGAGSWGTALAVLLAERNPILWDHREARAARIEATRRNERYLPGVHIPDGVRVTGELRAAVQGAGVLVIATPSHEVREVARRLSSVSGFDAGSIAVNAAKGLEERTTKRMSEVLCEELPQPPGHIVSLVGPSHAEEVARGMPTTVVAAGSDPRILQQVQKIFTTGAFRVYTNTDLVGVELAVSVKNVIAIAAGISDGLGFGDNSRGALLTRGLAEMARLGAALGAEPQTFAGLAGLGDLVTTATSRHSRNRNLGEALGRGKSLEEALVEITQVAEGVRTTRAVLELAARHDVEMPITMQVFEILFEGKEPKQALRDLMLRAPKAESWSASRGGS